MTVVQRTSSDVRLDPHLYVVFLDAAFHEQNDELAWEQLGHLRTCDVGDVLEAAVRRLERYLRRHRQHEHGRPPHHPSDPQAPHPATPRSRRDPTPGPASRARWGGRRPRRRVGPRSRARRLGRVRTRAVRGPAMTPGLCLRSLGRALFQRWIRA